MYLLVLSVLLVLGVSLFAIGRRRRERAYGIAGATLFVGSLVFFGLLSFWAEMLWFDEVGFVRRFWTRVLGQLGVAIAGGLVAAVVAWALTIPLREARAQRRRGVALASAIGLVWGAATWSVALRWALGVTTGTTEPILGMDTGFYLFTLPFLDALFWLFFLTSVVALATAAWVSVPRRAVPLRLRSRRFLRSRRPTSVACRVLDIEASCSR